MPFFPTIFMSQLPLRVTLPCLILGCSALIPGNSSALTVDYNDDRPALLRSCDRMLYVGDELADNCYQDILNDAGDAATNELPAVLLQAMAASALGDFRQANRLFREASDHSDHPMVLTAWGELYLRTHQDAEAAALFREVLLQHRDYLPARHGLAQALASQYAGGARDEVMGILEDHPESIPANLLLARMLLEIQNTDEAREVLERTTSYAESQEAPLLEVYALQASADLLDSNYPSTWTDKALADNPSYGGIYEIPAHFYLITYRYREAVELFRQAVEVEPTLATAHANLGINLLRINDINGARHHLQTAFESDPFNIETVNTLRLLDDLDDMRVSYADVYPIGKTPADAGQPASTDGQSAEPLGRMILRLDRDSVDALEPYVVELVSDAIRTFTERYRFQLEKPVVVELYHNHDDFGVRTVSTPGVGLLGVTFGYVVAMDSPKARSPDNFHWGSTLWHEIAHVFTLEAANHLLPRWFSEGISVYEEWNTGPLTSRELPMQVFDMFEQDRFLPVAELDAGFVRPTYEGQVTVSYMQAGLICDFIAERWGHDALVTMLRAFSIGTKTEDAVKLAINTEAEEFDRLFSVHMQERYADILEGRRHWQQLGQILQSSLSRAERDLEEGGSPLSAENLEALRQVATQRLEYYPDYVGADSAWLALSTIAEQLGDDKGALDFRWQWFKRGGALPSLLQQLAVDLESDGREDDAFRVLEALNWVMPYTVSEHERLGDYYLARGEPGKAIREFNALLGVRPTAASVVLLGKARAYQLQNNITQARRNVLLALEQSPFYRDAQHLLLELNAHKTGE